MTAFFWLCMGVLVGCVWTALAWHLGWRKGFVEADRIRGAADLEIWKTSNETATDEYRYGVDRSDA